MGCQKKITETIIDKKADYIIQVKSNQPNLHNNIALFFQSSASNKKKTLKGGIQTKRMKAAWDYKYLIKILTG